MQLVEGQTALVTGASRELGVEIARRLAKRGLDLVLVARSETDLNQVARDLRSETGRNVTVLVADLADRAAILALADAVAERGGIDILVNNAGIESSLRFHERTTDEIAQTIAINLTGPMLLTRALLPGMLDRGRGHIVNIASVGGVLGVPFNEPYSATKFGLVGFTRSLRLTAQASGWPVSASVVCPGFIGGAGLFAELQRQYGVSADDLGVCPLEDVGLAVVEAIESDMPDAFVVQGDVRQLVAMSAMDPTAAEQAMLGSPGTAMFRSVADARSANLL